jgi:hypothetical protein
MMITPPYLSIECAPSIFPLVLEWIPPAHKSTATCQLAVHGMKNVMEDKDDVGTRL